MIEKRGKIAELIFRNKENFYTVAVIENDDEMDQFTAVGNIPEARRGMYFSFKGSWKTHPTYGEQFAFTECRVIIPKGSAEIRDFLSSRIIKGIGPRLAATITDHFGEDTLRIIAEEPERLLEIRGVGKSKVEMITASYALHREFAEISMFFANYGIGAVYAKKMYDIYGADTVRVVMQNPYRLISDIKGIGFEQADQIAARLGVSPDSEERLKGGVKYMLGVYSQNGSTYAPFTELCEAAARMLDVSTEMVVDAAEQLAIDGDVRIDEIEKSRVIYKSKYYKAESNVARRLFALHSAAVRDVRYSVDSMIERSEAENGIRLSENQRTAVRTCVQNGVCVITGGPGTGKTTVINTIIDVFEGSGFDVAIAAPTGRAAKRITETSGRSAVTIHRLLEYHYSEDNDSMRFGKTNEDPLEHDVVIIDEMSMVDIMLMDALTAAVVTGTRLIMVGDADQLPSVNPGNVLRDIIDCEIINTVRLTEIFRQAEESMIVVNAHRINRGEYPYCNEKDKDFFLIRSNSDQAVLSTIIELCETRLPRFYDDCDSMRDIQVLTPTRKGIVGTANLNKELQAVLNPRSPQKAEKELQSRIFRVGDKVMQIKNNYQLEWTRTDDLSDGQGVYNGDIGFVTGIDTEINKLYVLFDDVKLVEYDFNQAEELELAYAMTVHKSQGSEFPVIVMPMTTFSSMLATRNLLYTGVTRGKKSVVLVGNAQAMQAMIDNNRITERYSGLKDRLRHFLALEEL